MLFFGWLGMRRLGLEGLGAGFVLCSLAHYVLCWCILRGALKVRWTWENWLLFVSLTAAALLIRGLSYVGLETVRAPAALAIAVGAGVASIHVIWGEIGGLRGLLAWRRPCGG
jgi:hypothetical protein